MRFYTQLLAEQICPKAFPFYAMVDDSVLMWQQSERLGETTRESISWWKALAHYATRPFAQRTRSLCALAPRRLTPRRLSDAHPAPRLGAHRCAAAPLLGSQASCRGWR